MTYGTYTGTNDTSDQTFTGTPLATSYAYDDAGNKTGETLPDGVGTTYTYDHLNRLTDVVTKQGTTTLFNQHYTLNHDGTRASSHVEQLQADGMTVETTDTIWTYDAMQRLTGESADSSNDDHDYTDTYTFDLQSNRVTKVHTGPGGGGASQTTAYQYNADDQLVAEGVDADTDCVPDAATATTYAYDDNGSMLTATTHAGGVATGVTTYTYDVRNKLVAIDVDGTTVATYAYDEAGNRVHEAVNNLATLYLTDTNNPTRYNQPVEAKDAGGNVMMTYLIGDRVYGQADGAGAVSYLLADGHGSTVALADGTGAVTATFGYDAFGGAIGFVPSSAGTVFLFGGDAVYDPASGMYLHGNGVRARLGFRFIQRDTYGGSTSDPLSLHKYLFVDANPITWRDPSGHMSLADQAFGLANEYRGDAELGLANVTSRFDNFLSLSSLDYGDLWSSGSDFFGQVTSSITDTISSLSSWLDASPTSVFQGFSQGAWAGVVNFADNFTFHQIDSLHSYRDSYWQQIGLAGTWTETGSNISSWVAVAAFDLAALAGAWNAVGGSTFNAGIGPGGAGFPFHITYGANGAWMEAIGSEFGAMFSVPASESVIAAQWMSITGIPIINAAAVMTQGPAYSCLSAAIYAMFRGLTI